MIYLPNLAALRLDDGDRPNRFRVGGVTEANKRRADEISDGDVPASPSDSDASDKKEDAAARQNLAWQDAIDAAGGSLDSQNNAADSRPAPSFQPTLRLDGLDEAMAPSRPKPPPSLSAPGEQAGAEEEEEDVDREVPASTHLLDAATMPFEEGFARLRTMLKMDGGDPAKVLDLSARTPDGDNVLHLLAKHTQLNLQEADGKTRAKKNQFNAIVKRIVEVAKLQSGASHDLINQRNNETLTPLFCALADERILRLRSHKESDYVVKKLMRHGANPNLLYRGMPALAFVRNHADRCWSLLNGTIKADVNQVDEKGNHPLLSIMEQQTTVELTPTGETDARGQPVMQTVVTYNFVADDVVQLLVEAKAPVDKPGTQGKEQCPLHRARTRAQVETLIKAGARAGALDADDCTPLHIVARHGEVFAVDALLFAGVIAYWQQRGVTAEHAMVKEVAASGEGVRAYWNMKDLNGETAFKELCSGFNWSTDRAKTRDKYDFRKWRDCKTAMGVMVKALNDLMRPGGKLQEVHNEKTTVMHTAASTLSKDIMLLWFLTQSDMSSKDNVGLRAASVDKDGDTALEWAVAHARAEPVSWDTEPHEVDAETADFTAAKEVVDMLVTGAKGRQRPKLRLETVRAALNSHHAALLQYVLKNMREGMGFGTNTTKKRDNIAEVKEAEAELLATNQLTRSLLAIRDPAAANRLHDAIKESLTEFFGS